MKKREINVIESWITILTKDNQDYISLTDIARFKDAERSDYILQNWMRLRSTIEFAGLWEKLHNPSFNSIEFDGIKTQAGSNSFFADSQTMDRGDRRHWNHFFYRQIWRHLWAVIKNDLPNLKETVNYLLK
jgi:hypothetical protein